MTDQQRDASTPDLTEPQEDQEESGAGYGNNAGQQGDADGGDLKPGAGSSGSMADDAS